MADEISSRLGSHLSLGADTLNYNIFDFVFSLSFSAGCGGFLGASLFLAVGLVRSPRGDLFCPSFMFFVSIVSLYIFFLCPPPPPHRPIAFCFVVQTLLGPFILCGESHSYFFSFVSRKLKGSQKRVVCTYKLNLVVRRMNLNLSLTRSKGGSGGYLTKIKRCRQPFG